jgi:hypothetical protein
MPSKITRHSVSHVCHWMICYFLHSDRHVLTHVTCIKQCGTNFFACLNLSIRIANRNRNQIYVSIWRIPLMTESYCIGFMKPTHTASLIVNLQICTENLAHEVPEMMEVVSPAFSFRALHDYCVWHDLSLPVTFVTKFFHYTSRKCVK